MVIWWCSSNFIQWQISLFMIEITITYMNLFKTPIYIKLAGHAASTIFLYSGINQCLSNHNWGLPLIELFFYLCISFWRNQRCSGCCILSLARHTPDPCSWGKDMWPIPRSRHWQIPHPQSTPPQRRRRLLSRQTMPWLSSSSTSYDYVFTCVLFLFTSVPLYL